MSCFIVGPKTINKILSYMPVQWKDRSPPTQLHDLTKAGQAMLKMNLGAYNDRYCGEKIEGYGEYTFHEIAVTPIEAYKALNCFLYQCAEGKVKKTKLYKAWRKIEADLADSIVCDTKEYDNAEWG